jgi:sugar fermentation stimulation protein A
MALSVNSSSTPALPSPQEAGYLHSSMRFPSPLVEGRLVRRYKRFLADVEFANGETVTVHCANPGSMIGLAEPGMRVFLSRATAERASCLVVGIGRSRRRPGRHQYRPSQQHGGRSDRRRRDPRARRIRQLRREVRYGKNSRIDFLLDRPGRPDAYVEDQERPPVADEGLAEFPDSVTARGAKHLAELSEMVSDGTPGDRWSILIQRTETTELCTRPRRPGLRRGLRSSAARRRRDACLRLDKPRGDCRQAYRVREAVRG